MDLRLLLQVEPLPRRGADRMTYGDERLRDGVASARGLGAAQQSQRAAGQPHGRCRVDRLQTIVDRCDAREKIENSKPATK